jgi:hypothetical protein
MPAFATKKFTPKQLNGLVDDALRGHFVPLGQSMPFEKALFALSKNPAPSQEEVERVRDMTKYDWRKARELRKEKPSPLVEFTATHMTSTGAKAAEIRDGVYLIENSLPISDIEARHKGIRFTPVEDCKFYVTQGQIQAAFAFKHPALAH